MSCLSGCNETGLYGKQGKAMPKNEGLVKKRGSSVVGVRERKQRIFRHTCSSLKSLLVKRTMCVDARKECRQCEKNTRFF